MADTSNMPGSGAPQDPLKPSSTPGGNTRASSMPSTDRKPNADVQTMADMIEAARRKAAQNPQAPRPEAPVAPASTVPIAPVAPAPRPVMPKPSPKPFVPMQGQKSVMPPAKQPVAKPFTPSAGGVVLPVAPAKPVSASASPKPVAPTAKAAGFQDRSLTPATPATSVAPAVIAQKNGGSMGMSRRAMPIVLIVMGVIELALIAGVVFLFMRSAPAAPAGADGTRLMTLEDRIYGLETKGQQINTQGLRIETLEAGTKNFATQKDVKGLEKATDKISGDSDADGLNDYREIVVVGTDPNVADTDGDSYADGSEVRFNYNPLGAGRMAGLEQGQTYMAQTWTGTMKSTLDDYAIEGNTTLILELTKDEKLSGSWSFTTGGTRYEAQLNGTYRLSVATDDVEAVADATIVIPETGERSTGTIGFKGSVDRTTGMIELRTVFNDAFAVKTLAGTKAVVQLSGKPEQTEERKPADTQDTSAQPMQSNDNATTTGSTEDNTTGTPAVK